MIYLNLILYLLLIEIVSHARTNLSARREVVIFPLLLGRRHHSDKQKG